LLSVLRALAGQQPVLVAIDDLQWLDAASAQALAFAARRLERDRVRFLLARRAGSPVSLEAAFAAPERLELGGLSLGALRSLLLDRLGVRPSRRLLRQIVDAGGGNPMFALEVGRLLAERGLPAAGEELPIPQTVSDLVGGRVAALPREVKQTLLAVALGHNLGRPPLIALVGDAAVADAVAAGVLVVEGDRVRAAHPLLATAARAGAAPAEQRALHLGLASVVTDAELRAHHLALGADAPDAGLASEVAAAAAHAAARGAAADAAGLAAHALRLTPPEAAERSERVLALAERLLAIGEVRRAADLLQVELEALPAGEPRALAHLLLNHATFHFVHVDQAGAYLQRALAESPPGSAVHARAAIRWARYLFAARVERIREAEQIAESALPEAERLGGRVADEALRVLAVVRTIRGRPIDALCERLIAVSDDTSRARRAADRLIADRLAVRGRVDEARILLHRLLALAEEMDETWVSVSILFQLCELELRAGDWDAAEGLLHDIFRSPSRSQLEDPELDRCTALLQAGRGRAAEAEELAAHTLEVCERRGLQWNRLEVLRARGLAALLVHEPAHAAEYLGAVWEHTEREGVEELGEFPVAPDLVEALLEAGRPHEVGAVTARLRTLADAQDHPWGLASAARCEALLSLVQSQDRDALERLAAAAADYAALGLRFDHARTLLAAGRAARRLRIWGAARDLLAQAATAFATIGSEGWEAEARSEVARIGGRSPAEQGGLSSAERQVAMLAAQGLANKEIAARLAVSVYTVERHLTHIYEKLGIRSRAELAHRLAESA
jgi:DNA-binding NarL/FixJ family response regulator